MEENINVITFIDDDGTEMEWEVIDSTVFNGANYILVTDQPGEEDAMCYVMKEVSGDGEELSYAEVEDDTEYEAVLQIFARQLEGDIDLEDA